MLTLNPAWIVNQNNRSALIEKLSATTNSGLLPIEIAARKKGKKWR